MIHKKFIVIYPFKFGDFLWTKFELEELSLRVDTEVWDLSRVINKKFSKIIYGQQSSKKNVLYFQNIFQFVLYLYKEIYKKSFKLYFFDKLKPTSLNAVVIRVILNFLIKRKNIKVLTEQIPGIPIVYAGDHAENLNQKIKEIFLLLLDNRFRLIFVIKLIKRFLFNKVNVILPLIYDFILVLGSNNDIIQGKNIYAHSWDYSQYLMKSSIRDNTSEINKNYAVLLDAPAPYFPDDKILTSEKERLSKNVWYPKLNNFLNFLDLKYNLDTIIAGHYKTCFESPSKVFNGREVLYGETLELVFNSQFVITRESTSISFAVIFRKPIIFIYSDQLKSDKVQMASIKLLARTLGTIPVNIENLSENLNLFLTVDEEKYAEYERRYLSQGHSIKPNSQIIYEEFIEREGLKS